MAIKNILLTLTLCQLPLNATTVRHQLAAGINLEQGRLTVSDTLTFERPATEFLFTLHKGLNPAVILPGASIERAAPPAGDGYGINTSTGYDLLDTYRVKLPKPARTFRLEYSGVINHALTEQPQEYARGFSQTPGTISPRGCYLSGSSGWYPAFAGHMAAYRLETRLPAPYNSVAGGARTRHRQLNSENISVWEEKEPQDDITLACGIYTEYSRPGRPALYAFLLSPAEELARSYLDAAEKYTRFYADLLGPYPYAKFALVENFWDTGYGMPSFTLLGSKVIRMPFIINSSYPHEILHNWWGNGVFVDYKTGNWCEGLTAYLADYLIAENHGKDRDYRAAVLQKYSTYVREGKDFPLTDFRARNSSASEAVGYGKALMFYHMLRGLAGDADFKAGLRDFYAANLGRTASFDSLKSAFEKRAGRLDGFFGQWLRREGAPQLAIKNARVSRLLEDYTLDFTLAQIQDGPPYALKVPVAIYIAGVAEPRRKLLDINRKEETFSYSVPVPILRLEIDPDFDVFRRLSPLETPPALAGLLGAKNPAIILPAGPGFAAWNAFAGTWTKDAANLPVITQSTAATAGAYWVLGAENALAPVFERRLETYGARFSTYAITLDGREFPRAGHTFVFADYHPANPALSSGLVIARSTGALNALAAKLPHYGKYSWLVFDAAMNSAATGFWPAPRSPLTADFGAGPLPGDNYAPRHPLAPLPSVFSAQRMAADIAALAALPGGRGPGSGGLKAAAAYITKNFEAAGLQPFPAGPPAPRKARAWKQSPGFLPVPGAPHNLVTSVPGLKTPGEYVVLAAHYDHLAAVNGTVYPGADDNASGTALLLELARYYAAHPQARTIVFVSFDGEELSRRGSRAFLAGLAPELKDRINAALNFDTVGRLGAGKILLLGSSSSDKWPHILRGAGFVTGAGYALVKEQLDSSDQVSFIEKGIPAIQFFSGPNADYHKPADTADKTDAAGLVKQAEFAKEIIEYLAGDAPFITRPGQAAPAAGSPPAAAGARRTATGLVPDFTYQGAGQFSGVRAQDITPGSPLALAGVKPGEIIIELNNRPITGLKEYAEILKTLDPGAKIPITVINMDKLGILAAKREAVIELVPAN